MLFNRLIITLIVYITVILIFAYGHEHHHENPSFKYSYEANKDFQKLKEKSKGDLSGSDCDYKEWSPSSGNSNRCKHKYDERRRFSGNTDIWLYSMGSTVVISVAPFLLLFFIQLDNTDSMKPRLKLLLAFASGGLLGDAFLHLIPHATHPHVHDHIRNDGHDHSHSHEEHGHNMTVGIYVLSGIVAFLTVEKCVRFFKCNNGHTHGHVNKTMTGSDHKKNEKKSKKNNEKIEISGYLNLAADFAHNFTDGLAIGASYYAGKNVGLVTSMTILLHEVPHEIGDYAILIKSGCSRRKALFLQLLTALGAFAGNILALLGTDPDSNTPPWFLPFTAGGFIYIATVSVLPELLEESTKLGQSIKEISALLTGVALMIVIANFE